MIRRAGPLTRGVAFAAWGAAAVMSAGGVAIQALHPVPFLANTFAFGPYTMVAYAALAIGWSTVGAILVLRRPGNAVGPCMLLVGAGYAGSVLAPEITFQAAASGDTGLARAAGWWTVLACTVTSVSIYLLFIFPTGRGHTPAWHRVARGVFVLGVAFDLWVVTRPGPLFLIPSLDNPLPLGPDLGQILGDSPVRLLLTLLIGTGPLLLAAVVSRYRVADRIERLQLRWVLSAMVLATATLMVALVASVGGSTFEAPLTAYAVAGLTVPVACGVAILRYRLYDIDRIISRGLAWGFVTAVLAVLVVGVVLALQAVLANVTQGETIVVAASTLTAAALVQPLRRRVQAGLDRRFDRARYDAQRTVDAFAAEVRHDVDLAALRTALLATTQASVRPAGVAVWLRTASDHPRQGTS